MDSPAGTKIFGNEIREGDLIDVTTTRWAPIIRIDPYHGPHDFAVGIAIFDEPFPSMTITTNTRAIRRP